MKSQAFNLSSEEVKKLNSLLPKGYKFITTDQLSKRGVQKIKKKIINVVVEPQSNVNIAKVKIEVKREEIQPPKPILNKKSTTKQPSQLNLVKYESSGSIKSEPLGAAKVFQRLKKHPAINLLTHVKMKEYEANYKEIQQKIINLGQIYTLLDFVQDIQKICLRIYQAYPKTDPKYTDAANIENFLNGIIKNQKMLQNRRNQGLGFSRVNSNISTNFGAKSQNLKRKNPIKTNQNNNFNNFNILPTLNQKRILGLNIKKLPSQDLQKICWMIFETIENKEYSFDIDTLHVKKFRELQEYVKKCMEKTGDYDLKNEADEQFSNESSFVIEDEEEEKKA